MELTSLSSGIAAGSFGVAAGLAALFFLEGVPRVRKDILQKLPIIGDYWIQDIPPSDNVSSTEAPLASVY